MEIYLVRHTTPAVEKGICYGQADLDITETFKAEAAEIKQLLPAAATVYSSPLQRCSKLAAYIYNNSPVIYKDDLKELHCGDWELQSWDDIPRHEIDPWMNDFVNVVIPGGESYVQLYERTTTCFTAIAAAKQVAVVFTHGGVIRSLLSYITATPLLESFAAFKLHYGCVVHINTAQRPYTPTILANKERTKEQHKPSYF